MLLLIIPMVLIFCLFDNTLYTMPLFGTLLYMLNVPKFRLTYNQWVSLCLCVIFSYLLLDQSSISLGLSLRLKKGALFLGFLLMAIAQIMSIFYVKITPTYLQISFFGFFYLFLYVFFVSTTKSRLSYVMKIMFFLSILLTLELRL